MPTIKVNDELQEVALPLTLTELIGLNKILQPDMVSVQINGEFIDRGNFGATAINDGDVIDFLYFMGGGK
ncbi:MAG: sulfur carrier protein ThiS [Tannerellaceae bacterium]|jgi:sulfur carrier protein|nr:sulfur carrier protein ThiS [Tannerellaceae bacterium]